MNKCRINIALFEPSELVCEGMANLLLKEGSHFFLFHVNDIEELYELISKEKIHIVLINPSMIQNRIIEFNRLKNLCGNISWIGLVYSFYDADVLSRFDDIILITDLQNVISEKIKRAHDNCKCQKTKQEYLSGRETMVLLHLVKGLSNKEIAEQLNISIHTVISHRRNIIEKTGIRSLPGLTIYAISKKLIPLE